MNDTDMDHAARHARVRAIFMAVADLPQAEVAPMLLRRCNGDEALRREVETLLGLSQDPAQELDLAADAMRRRLAAPAANPMTIGRYRVLELIGEGGMGAVYRCQAGDGSPVVAVKVLRGSGGREGSRRFEIEARALSRLDHPGIARVLEVGIDEEYPGGRPFLAMELVDGPDLVTHARVPERGLRERVELVALVAEAVQHAHVRGVIHRDLKPSNILVDSCGQPRVLDFGIARLGDGTGASARRTGTGDLVGTLAYMSPEQVTAHPDDVDLRCDVYALGVLLFEVLVGRTPHDLRGRSIGAAVRIIGSVPARSIGSIDPRLRGALDAVVARALAADPEDRYRSAVELSDDLRRWLTGEPIAVQRDSLARMVTRRVRRYRRALALVAAVALVIALLAVQAVRRAHSDRMLAQMEREARMAVSAAEGRAQLASAFLVNVFGLTDPDIPAASPLVLEQLSGLASEIPAWFGDAPEAAGEMNLFLGRVWLAAGRPADALPYLRAALDSVVDALRCDALWAVAHAEEELDDVRWAADRRSAEDELAARLVEHAPSVAAALARLRDIPASAMADEGRALVLEAIGLAAAIPEDDPGFLATADALYLRGWVLASAGAWDAAIELLQASLGMQRRLRPDHHVRTTRATVRLGSALAAAGRPDEAEALLRGIIGGMGGRLAPEHWYRGVVESELGEVLFLRGDLAGAEQLLRTAHARLEAARGAANPLATTCLDRLVAVLVAEGRGGEAAAARQRIARALADAPSVPRLSRVASVFDAGDGAAALVTRLAAERRGALGAAPLFAEALTLVEAMDHADPRAVLLVDLLSEQAHRHANGRARDPFLVETWARIEACDARMRDAGTARHLRKQALAAWHVASFELESGDPVAGELAARRALALLAAAPPERYGFAGIARGVLGACLARQGRIDEALEEMVPACALVMKEMGLASADTRIALDRLARVAADHGRADVLDLAVAPVLEQLLREAKDPALQRRLAASILRAEACVPSSKVLARQVVAE